VHFELKSFIGTFCLYLYDNNWNYITSACSSSPPVTLDYTSSSGGVYFIQVYANSTPYGSSTAELRWSKSHGWFQPDEGTDKSNPMLIYDAGSFCGVEGTLQSGDHWYKYSPSSLSSYAWVVSIWGSSGTDYDLYIYDCNGNRIASAITGSYPDYTYVKTSTSCILINVHPYSTASPYEYDLQVSKPYLVSYSLSSTTVKPGETFTVYYKIYNPLHHSISVVLGASIEDPNGKIIDDPSHDTSVNVQPGTNWYSRSFTVPKDAFLGTYKLHLGLWGKRNSDGTLDYNFDYKIFDSALQVSVPKNPEITYAGASPSSLHPGDTTTVTVKWIFYNMCPGRCIVKANSFGDWAKTQQLAVIYDGVDGNYGNENSYSFPVTLPADISIGRHYIRVGFCYSYSFASDYDSLGQCTHRDIPIDVSLISTSVAVSPSSFTVNSGGTVSFTATLKDQGGNPLANKLITWGANSGSFNPSSSYTDNNGKVYTTYYAPTVCQQTSITVTASFGGDSRYAASSGSSQGTVNPQTYQVTVDPNGGRIYVDGNPITSAQTYSWACNSQHTLDPDSGYQPSPGVKKIFTQWSDGSTADPRTITVTGSATYTAYWKTQYQLTISSSDGGTTNPAPGSSWYDSGSSVSVTAIASSGYKFDHWELDGTNVGSANPYTVNMDKPHTLKAVFTVLTTFDDRDGKKDLRVFRPSNGYWYTLLSSTNYDRTKAFSIQWGVNGDVPFIGDIEGDGKADAIIFRPSNGYWYVLLSSNNYDRTKPFTRQWGISGDVPLVGDLDGDRKADLIVFRPSNGYWYALLSGKNYDRTQAFSKQWGVNGDKPLIGDIDGDGKADIIVWRPSNGYWYALLSSTNYDRTKAFSKQWGVNGDVPLVGDIDGDGKADIIVWRPSNGYWYALLSSTNYDRTKAFSKQWGVNGDVPLVGDIDGDGKADIIVWRPSNGYWYALLSSTNYDRTKPLSKQWGVNGDKPLIGDIDGDGKADLIVFRPSNGYWYALLSGKNYDRTQAFSKQWGTSGDVPI
jgi:GH43 family beta-xylosidase